MADMIGFIGLGVMGLPMARNLQRAGYELLVHNLTPRKAEVLARAGSPREVAESCHTVITVLPDSADVEQVVAGPSGLMDGLRTGALVVDMSTISPRLTRRLAACLVEMGASMLDAPVSGGDVGATRGTLTIMVGGETADFARARPLFEVMGENIVHVGPIGAGQVAKAANQVVVGLTIAAVAVALALGVRGGVPAETLLDVLGTGLAGNRVMELKREKLLSGVFEPGFRAELHHKDLGIALAEGRESGAALPVTALVDQLFGVMARKGWGKEDHSALVRLIEALSESRSA